MATSDEIIRDAAIAFITDFLSEFKWEKYRLLFPTVEEPPIIFLGRIEGEPISVSFTRSPEENGELIAYGLVKEAKCMVTLPSELTAQIGEMVDAYLREGPQ